MIIWSNAVYHANKHGLNWFASGIRNEKCHASRQWHVFVWRPPKWPAMLKPAKVATGRLFRVPQPPVVMVAGWIWTFRTAIIQVNALRVGSTIVHEMRPPHCWRWSADEVVLDGDRAPVAHSSLTHSSRTLFGGVYLWYNHLVHILWLTWFFIVLIIFVLNITGVYWRGSVKGC